MGMPIITASSTTTGQAATDIIESIAFEQTALSHILNAEGEKLQAIIAMPDVTQAQLLATNSSVKSMVDSIARLEMILQSKAELVTTTFNSTGSAATNVTVSENFVEPLITVTKSSNSLFTIDINNPATADYSFAIEYTPVDLPLNFITLPSGVTAVGNVFTIPFTNGSTISGTIVFTIGSGAYMQTVTINYAS